MELRALIVDDEPMVRQATMRALTREGFRCESAHDGRRARQMVDESPYDVVVTDLCMPGENGHDLVLYLLGKPSRPAIVTMTGVIEPRVEAYFRRQGVEEIVFKPVDYSTFGKRIVEFAERRRQNAPAPSDPADSRDTAPIGEPFGSQCVENGREGVTAESAKQGADRLAPALKESASAAPKASGIQQSGSKDRRASSRQRFGSRSANATDAKVDRCRAVDSREQQGIWNWIRRPDMLTVAVLACLMVANVVAQWCLIVDQRSRFDAISRDVAEMRAFAARLDSTANPP
jgi:DNA-binding response OmpR family regulator